MKSIHEYIKLVEAEQPGYNPTDPTGWEWVKQKAGQGVDDLEKWARSGRRDAAIARGQGQDVMPSDPTNPAYKRAYPQQATAPSPTQYSPSGVATTGWDVKPQATAQASAPAQATTQAPASGTAATKTPTTKPVTSAKPAFKDLGAQYGYNSPQEVQAIQQQLVSMGYPIAVDGKFGPKTQQAYRQAYSQMYGQQPGQTDPNPPVPQNYQQGRTAKQDLSKSMAAATGMPNPYATVPPSQQKQDLLAKAAELTRAGDSARAKIYTDAASRMNESTELNRIKDLIKY
jgi:hypothetical protein